MADNTLFTHDEQVALAEDTQARMNGVAREWLNNPKVKSALLRDRADDSKSKKSP